MEITASTVQGEYEWVCDQESTVVPLINDTREFLGEMHGVDVGSVTSTEYEEVVSTVFTDGELAVNVTALLRCLRELSVQDDYTGFIIDELLGQELASMIAGQQPLHLLGQATFYYTEMLVDDDDMTTGLDDLYAGLAAGFQTRLPGWSWRDRGERFSISK